VTTDTFTPVFDPETGEVLADTPEDRDELIRRHASIVIEARRLEAQARESMRVLTLAMQVGDAVAGEGHQQGWAVMVKPPASPKRQIIQHALEDHAESLTPLGLAPRDEVITRRVYPKVSELSSAQARAALARLGLTPEHFLLTPERGEPKIEVIPPPEGE
jgi:hypothetical protein